MNFFWVFLGGGIGSLFRYGTSLAALKLFSSTSFPLGTFLSNLISCIIFALATGLTADKISPSMKLFILTGICGGFSTFSSFSNETFYLFRSGHAFVAVLNIVISIFTCLLVFYFFAKNTSV